MSLPWSGMAGVAAVTAGVWLAFGTAFGLIAGGVLLILDAIT